MDIAKKPEREVHHFKLASVEPLSEEGMNLYVLNKGPSATSIETVTCDMHMKDGTQRNGSFHFRGKILRMGGIEGSTETDIQNVVRMDHFRVNGEPVRGFVRRNALGLFELKKS